MPFILVTLLAFALVVTVAGFFLSVKSPAREQETFYTDARVGRRVIRSYPPQTEAIPVRARASRSTEAIVPRASRALSVPTIGIQLGRRGTGEPLPWKAITVGLVSIFVLGLYTFGLVFPRSVAFNPIWFATNEQSTPQATPEPIYGASKALVRLSQLDPAQYNTSQDYSAWAYSACSAAAMTEVFNAYGRHFRIADVLKVEAAIGEITPQLGLVEDVGIQRTAAKFGFKTTWGYNLALNQVIDIANHGRPVIVGWPPARYDGGHLVVVLGGNNSSVYLADSSLYNRTTLTHAQFMKWWAGFYAIATPA